ncbi:hypothetical protein [Azovibrio restrictus]|uniref:hypothetical protein n=1 Tax=Azovibrio restrictus TaxID=146938 RepID=UPI0012EC1D3F|nr:hypothetical protein [Azovibrio restrictus]
MEYKKTITPSGNVQFRTEVHMDLDEFKSLMSKLASKFELPPEWIAMPEAEIGKITTKSIEIYAKLDFAYGLELDCKGLSTYETSLVESVLAENDPANTIKFIFEKERQS